jgi:hypothetical protein
LKIFSGLPARPPVVSVFTPCYDWAAPDIRRAEAQRDVLVEEAFRPIAGERKQAQEIAP